MRQVGAGLGEPVQLGVHVAGVEGVHAQLGVLDGEHRRGVVEGRLGRAVRPPAGVGLDGGVGRHVDDAAAAGAQCRQDELDQRDRREGVHLEHLEQVGERVLGERGQRARPEDAGVVDEQVEAAGDGGGERRAVVVVDDVTGDRGDGGGVGEAGDGGGEARRRRGRRRRRASRGRRARR